MNHYVTSLCYHQKTLYKVTMWALIYSIHKCLKSLPFQRTFSYPPSCLNWNSPFGSRDQFLCNSVQGKLLLCPHLALHKFIFLFQHLEKTTSVLIIKTKFLQQINMGLGKTYTILMVTVFRQNSPKYFHSSIWNTNILVIPI